MFRLYEKKDAQYCAKLINQLGYECSLEEWIQREAKISKYSNHRTYVFEEDSRAVALMGVVILHMYEYEQDFLRINVLVVDEKYRGRGIGKQMLQEIEILAKEEGVGTITLNSGDRHERYPAHKLYRSAGYENKSLAFIKKI